MICVCKITPKYIVPLEQIVISLIKRYWYISLILTSQYGISMPKKKKKKEKKVLLQQKDIMVNITKDEWRLSLPLYCISGSTN